jgi:hypothetical protein
MRANSPRGDPTEGSGRSRAARKRRGKSGSGRLGDLLAPLLARLGLEGRVKQQLVAALWPELVGRIAAGHSWPETVRDGVLLVGADTHAWAQELDLRRGELMQRIEARVGPGVIRDLHFRGGRRAKPPGASRSAPSPHSQELHSFKVSPGWERAVEEAVAAVEQEEVRERLRKTLASLAGAAERRRSEGWRRCARCGRLHRRPRRLCASCARWSPPQRR